MLLATPIVLTAMFAMGFQAAGGEAAPVPFHLTDACKAQTVQVAGTNYSYSTFEHCLNK